MERDFYSDNFTEYTLDERKGMAVIIIHELSRKYGLEIPSYTVLEPTKEMLEHGILVKTVLAHGKEDSKIYLPDRRIYDGHNVYAHAIFHVLLHANNDKYKNLVEENAQKLRTFRIDSEKQSGFKLLLSTVDEVLFEEFATSYVGQRLGEVSPSTPEPSYLFSEVNNYKLELVRVLRESKRQLSKKELIKYYLDVYDMASFIGRYTGILMALEKEELDISKLATNVPKSVSESILNTAGKYRRIEAFTTDLAIRVNN